MGYPKSTNLPESGVAAGTGVQHGSARGQVWLWLVILGAAAVLAFWYFRGGKDSSATRGAAAAAPPGPAAGARPAPHGVPVLVATAARSNLPIYLNGLGTVTAFNTVTVRSRVDGQIVKINFTEGQDVRQGDDLADIDARPFQVQLEQAEGQLAKDQAQLKNAKALSERGELLLKQGIISRQDVETQQASVLQLEGAIKGDQAAIDSARLQMTYAHITAPIGGRAGLRLVDVGNMVRSTDTNGLLVITQLHPISVIFSLPQDELSQVLPHLNGSLAAEAYDHDDANRLATGKLVTIDNQIDTATGTYKLKAVFENRDNALFPNQFVNVHLLVDRKQNVTTIPSAAVQRGPQGAYVYLGQKDGTVKIQLITISFSSGEVVGISKGLQPGDVVVVDGQDKLNEGTAIEARPVNGTPTKGASSGSQQ